MATTAHPQPRPQSSPTQSKPLPSPTALIATQAVSLWHLLSLDAPTVAAVWTWFLASSNQVRLPAASILAMALAVWMLYAVDRLLDVCPIDSRPRRENLEARHLFHYRHRRVFLGLLILSSLALVLLLPQLAPASIRLNLILGTLLAGYFLLIHAPIPNLIPNRNAQSSPPKQSHAAQSIPHRVPKEFAVGVFFSVATFIPTVAREPALRLTLLPAALLFALLCSLNCLFIHAWEHPNTTSSTHPATRLVLNSLRGVSLAAVLLSLTLAALSLFAPAHLPPWPIPAAAALSALLLFLLDHLHRTYGLPATPLRAAADLCLLTPLLLLPFLHA